MELFEGMIGGCSKPDSPALPKAIWCQAPTRLAPRRAAFGVVASVYQRGIGGGFRLALAKGEVTVLAC